jgi:GrpB-like predicted nucleotidyltransferase (UPF0157 family)
MTGPDPADVASYESYLAEVAIGGPEPLAGPIEISEYDPEWPRAYAREEARLRSTLGEVALRIEHAGSTAVPGLPAKPILDVVLEVADSAAEAAYVPALEAVGYALRIREPDWFEHRLLRRADPRVNLHVFTAGCIEVERMLAFRDRLRESAADRERYAAAKRELAARDWRYTQQYADAKAPIVLEILARAARAG